MDGSSVRQCSSYYMMAVSKSPIPELSWSSGGELRVFLHVVWPELAWRMQLAGHL